MDDRMRATAAERLEKILQQLERPLMVIRFPERAYELVPGEGVKTAAQMARDLIEEYKAGPPMTAIALPSTRDEDGYPEWDIEYPRAPFMNAMRSLLWFLKMPAQERHFVECLLDNPRDKVGLLAFADYLEEGQRAEELKAVRELARREEALEASQERLARHRERHPGLNPHYGGIAEYDSPEEGPMQDAEGPMHEGDTMPPEQWPGDMGGGQEARPASEALADAARDIADQVERTTRAAFNGRVPPAVEEALAGLRGEAERAGLTTPGGPEIDVDSFMRP